MPSLETLPFENRYLRLGPEFGTEVAPTALPAPYPVAYNEDAAALLGLNGKDASGSLWVDAFSGRTRLPGSEPFAMVYSGHQFGVYVPRLGDGRALLLGQVKGADGQRWDLHLKGAGPTPYSRMGDGRAVLRSTIREYLASEALHHLGIPSTRALCIVGSDVPVYREEVETAATLVRLSPSHVRFGTFEYFAHTGRHAELRRLADHVIAEHFPELTERADRDLELLRAVVARTAGLIAGWQAVGFCHGVLNTDNMSILGLTLDYGPYGFVDAFEPGYIPNHSDERGRYALDQQPSIGLWNLTRLAEALLPLGIHEEAAVEVLRGYEPLLRAAFARRMRAKLGLRTEREDDAALTTDLLALMARERSDYTRTFRLLGGLRTDAPPSSLRDQFVDREAFDAWSVRYTERLRAEHSDDRERAVRMAASNPKYVLRSYLAETAIRKATQDRDYTEIETLRRVLRRPFDEQPEFEVYAAEPPSWGRHLELSCSS